MKAGGDQEFPYETLEELVDDVMDGLESEGFI